MNDHCTTMELTHELVSRVAVIVSGDAGFWARKISLAGQDLTRPIELMRLAAVPGRNAHHSDYRTACKAMGDIP